MRFGKIILLGCLFIFQSCGKDSDSAPGVVLQQPFQQPYQPYNNGNPQGFQYSLMGTLQAMPQVAGQPLAQLRTPTGVVYYLYERNGNPTVQGQLRPQFPIEATVLTNYPITNNGINGQPGIVYVEMVHYSQGNPNNPNTGNNLNFPYHYCGFLRTNNPNQGFGGQGIATLTVNNQAIQLFENQNNFIVRESLQTNITGRSACVYGHQPIQNSIEGLTFQVSHVVLQ